MDAVKVRSPSLNQVACEGADCSLYTIICRVSTSVSRGWESIFCCRHLVHQLKIRSRLADESLDILCFLRFFSYYTQKKKQEWTMNVKARPTVFNPLTGTDVLRRPWRGRFKLRCDWVDSGENVRCPSCWRRLSEGFHAKNGLSVAS